LSREQGTPKVGLGEPFFKLESFRLTSERTNAMTKDNETVTTTNVQLLVQRYQTQYQDQQYSNKTFFLNMIVTKTFIKAVHP